MVPVPSRGDKGKSVYSGPTSAPAPLTVHRAPRGSSLARKGTANVQIGTCLRPLRSTVYDGESSPQVSRKRTAAELPEATPPSKQAATHELAIIPIPAFIEPARPLSCLESGCRLDHAATTYLYKYMAKGEKDVILAKWRKRNRDLWVEEPRQNRGAVHMHVAWHMPISDPIDVD